MLDPMKRVHVFLHDAYGDWELGYILPELISKGVEVLTFGISATAVRSAGSLQVTPTLAIDQVDAGQMLILPGGRFWSDLDDARLDQLVSTLHDRSVPIAAICAATGYLARLSLLDSVAHTSNSIAFLRERAPGYRGDLHYRNAAAVSDGKIITAGGLGAVDFTYEILRELGVGDPRVWYRAFKYGEEPGATNQRFAILLSKIPGRETSPQTIRRHIEHIRKLDDDGQLVLCGPFIDHPSGLVIVKAGDVADATRIAMADPFVREGVRTFEVRTWLLGHRENSYLGDP